MARVKKQKTDVYIVTNPLESVFENAHVLNDAKYANDEENFNRRMVEIENKIRRRESETLRSMQNLRIDGIVIK